MALRYQRMDGEFLNVDRLVLRDMELAYDRELNEQKVVVETIQWHGGPVHLRSNVQDHLGACGEPGGAGRVVKRLPVEEVTCDDCGAKLASLLLEEPRRWG